MSNSAVIKRISPHGRAQWLRHVVALLAVAFVLESIHGYGEDWFIWKAESGSNPAFQEGLAWRFGRTDLRYHLLDSALNPADGRYYNVYPPFLSVIGFASALTIPASMPMPDQASMPVFHWIPFLVVGLPVPFAAYYAFLNRAGSSFWAAALTISLIGGTAILPCFVNARFGYLSHMNHLVSQTGLLLLINETLHRRRLGIMVTGLIMSAWTRQLTIVYSAIALLLMMMELSPEKAGSDSTCSSSPGRPLKLSGARRRFIRPAIFGCALASVVAVQLGLNWLKFGSPLDSGYTHLYDDRTTPNALNAQAHGLFSVNFVPSNAYYMNLATPWKIGDEGRWVWDSSPFGASVWLSTPIALLALLGVRRWWRDRAARLLMLGSGAIIAVHLLYHNTGWVQTGYYRFALDYLPAWILVATPFLTSGWRRWATLGCTAWSLTYFALVHFLNHPMAM